MNNNLAFLQQVKDLNVNGYIGESTKREYGYSVDHDKKIRWLELIGAPHLRDPESPCGDFEPIGTAYGNQYKATCETDGHYMCEKCIYQGAQQQP